MTFDRFVLRSSARWITVEPADAAVPPSGVLYLDRGACTASVRDRVDCAALAEPDAEEVVFGLAGLVRTLVDMYLIVVRARAPAGPVLEEPVWRVTRLAALPVRGPALLRALPDVSRAERTEEARLRRMLDAALALPGFYFAHGLDLTRPAQTRARGGEVPAPAAFARADLRFVWNRFAAKPLADLGLVAWVVPLILGFVAARAGMVNGRAVALTLIARRAADRPGLRFTARGADAAGHVSNYVQTEQIVAHGDAFASYVLLRGSIPLLWEQPACIRYKPAPALKPLATADAADAPGAGSALAQTALERHFAAVVAAHGPTTAVSLIDARGAEKPLGDAFAAAVATMQARPDGPGAKVRYVPWDFHAKTKGMKYENVDLDLIPALDADIARYSYFLSRGSGGGGGGDGDGGGGGEEADSGGGDSGGGGGGGAEPERLQAGVFRVNCIDSLDRTNVVQCVIAHRIMDDALQQLGVLDGGAECCTAAKFAPFEREFKAAWADHADAIAKVYAGSGALKTDYTRTGKRTKPGMAVDGARSALRYLYQNFWDGRRQDGIDLFLGVVEPAPPPAGAGDGGAKARSLDGILSKAEPPSIAERLLPPALALCLVAAAAGALLPQRAAVKGAVVAGAFTAAALLFARILAVGHKLVARPRFNGTN